MASLENLQARAMKRLSDASVLLHAMPATVIYRDSAINTLDKTRQTVGSINFPGYFALRKAGRSVNDVFTQPIDNAIKSISGRTPSDVPYDLNKILEQQTGAQPDVGIVNAVTEIKKLLKAATFSLRLLKSTSLRFLMGPWSIVVIFACAILFGICYFVFQAADVPAPLSATGAKVVVQKAGAGVTDLKSILATANGSVDALAAFNKKLTSLISGIPALIAAFGLAFAALRKVVIR